MGGGALHPRLARTGQETSSAHGRAGQRQSVCCGQQSSAGASSPGGHRRPGVRVVPHQPDSLLEGPSHPARPLHVATLEGVSQQGPLTLIEQVPRADKIECGIGGAEPSPVEDADESSVSNQNIVCRGRTDRLAHFGYCRSMSRRTVFNVRSS